MNVVSSYRVEIVGANKIFLETIRVYREAVSFLICVYKMEWDFLSAIDKQKQRFNSAEHLIHATKYHTAKYDFDSHFYKMPSYLRRAAIQCALGAVSSYHSHLLLWEGKGRSGKTPRLQPKPFAMPTFYKQQMFLPAEDSDTAFVKLYHNHDWVWVKIRLCGTDVKYLQKHWSHCSASAPTLEKRHGKYYLRFSFQEQVSLSKKESTDQRICAVDLGINSDAVCSIMASDGTVLARKFINFASEKDHLNHVVNRIRKFQRQHGSSNVVSFWQYARRLNDELAKKVASAIVLFAAEQDTDCIVFEYLDFRGRKFSGSKKQKLSLWRKNGIQRYAEHRAHRLGIRISRICAWGTSRLAYDGSGLVTRNPKNYSLAVFPNGKQYNCDLSASYNIGARYFLREILKPLPAKVRSRLTAKVPEAGRRTSGTLYTLLAVTEAIQHVA